MHDLKEFSVSFDFVYRKNLEAKTYLEVSFFRIQSQADFS